MRGGGTLADGGSGRSWSLELARESASKWPWFQRQVFFSGWPQTAVIWLRFIKAKGSTIPIFIMSTFVIELNKCSRDLGLMLYVLVCHSENGRFYWLDLNHQSIWVVYGIALVTWIVYPVATLVKEAILTCQVWNGIRASQKRIIAMNPDMIDQCLRIDFITCSYISRLSCRINLCRSLLVGTYFLKMPDILGKQAWPPRNSIMVESKHGPCPAIGHCISASAFP